MGHAMETLLAAGADTHVWEITPEGHALPPDIAAWAARADFLLACVPTVAHAAVLSPLDAVLHPAAAILSIAKGLDDEARTAADILAAYCGGRRSWGVLGGPMIADEIIAHRPAYADLGTEHPAVFARGRALFEGTGLALSHARDAHAVSWCGVLKNVYAPLVGVADERRWGDNARGHLVMAAIGEMQGLLALLSGSDASAYGDAGLADFVTTVTSASSHHHALGRRVARGDVSAMRCEGTHSLAVLRGRRTLDTARFPLFKIADGLVEAPLHVPADLGRWLGAT